MLRLSHRFAPPWFHFSKKSTGQGSGCQRLRYIHRRKVLPPGGGFRLPCPPPAAGFSFLQPYHEKSRKKKKVGLPTLSQSLIPQGFPSCRVISPCDIRPAPARICAPWPPLPRRSGSAQRRRPGPQLCTPAPSAKLGALRSAQHRARFARMEWKRSPRRPPPLKFSGRKLRKRG